jgi:hypothetical protein
LDCSTGNILSDFTIHTFLASKQPDGSVVLMIFRRTDTHEQSNVMNGLVFDKNADIDTIERGICEAFNRELATRKSE